MDDRRQFPRVTGPLAASWHRGPAHAAVRIANLSVGGCFVESLDPEPPSGRFRLRLQLAANESLWVSAEVTHVQPRRGFGVRFVDLRQPQQELLRQTVERLDTD